MMKLKNVMIIGVIIIGVIAGVFIGSSLSDYRYTETKEYHCRTHNRIQERTYNGFGELIEVVDYKDYKSE